MKRGIKPIVGLAIATVLVSKSAASQLDLNGRSVSDFLARHAALDWGDAATADDWQAQDEALAAGQPVVSQFHLEDNAILWVVTKVSDSLTHVLIPDEMTP